MNFYTADHHFGHQGIIELNKRPFASIDEMNEELIKRWNSKVTTSDNAYFLGDFGMTKKSSKISIVDIFNSLNGRKHLIIGNHDKRIIKNMAWGSVQTELELHDRGKSLVLYHYPIRSWKNMWRGSLHLHGHVHGNLPDYNNTCDVGVDKWDYAPVSLQDIMIRMSTQGKNPDFCNKG